MKTYFRAFLALTAILFAWPVQSNDFNISLPESIDVIESPCGYTLRVDVVILRRDDCSGGNDNAGQFENYGDGTTMENYADYIIDGLNLGFDYSQYPSNTYEWMNDAPFFSEEREVNGNFPSQMIQFELGTVRYENNSAMYLDNPNNQSPGLALCGAITIVAGGTGSDTSIGQDLGLNSGLPLIVGSLQSMEPLIHEMGHQLGLNHIFYRTNYFKSEHLLVDIAELNMLTTGDGAVDGIESEQIDIVNGIISGINCLVSGDKVCDTFITTRDINEIYNENAVYDFETTIPSDLNPFMPNEIVDLNNPFFFDFINSNNYNLFPIFQDFTDYVSYNPAEIQQTNFMSYLVSGRDHFTPGQYRKMIEYIGITDRLIQAACPRQEIEITADVNCRGQLEEVVFSLSESSETDFVEVYWDENPYDGISDGVFESSLTYELDSPVLISNGKYTFPNGQGVRVFTNNADVDDGKCYVNGLSGTVSLNLDEVNLPQAPNESFQLPEISIDLMNECSSTLVTGLVSWDYGEVDPETITSFQWFGSVVNFISDPVNQMELTNPVGRGGFFYIMNIEVDGEEFCISDTFNIGNGASPFVILEENQVVLPCNGGSVNLSGSVQNIGHDNIELFLGDESIALEYEGLCGRFDVLIEEVGDLELILTWGENCSEIFDVYSAYDVSPYSIDINSIIEHCAAGSSSLEAIPQTSLTSYPIPVDVEYLWTRPNGINESNASITLDEPGTYLVSLIGEEFSDCPVSAEYFLENTIPVFNANAFTAVSGEPSCEGEVEFSVVSSFVEGVLSFSWTNLIGGEGEILAEGSVVTVPVFEGVNYYGLTVSVNNGFSELFPYCSGNVATFAIVQNDLLLGCSDPLAVNFVQDADCESECFYDCGSCMGDINMDGSITSADLSGFLDAFGAECSEENCSCNFDFDGDGNITVMDLGGMLGLLGETCE